MRLTLALIPLLLISTLAQAAPSLLIVKNQFGERSNLTNVGSTLPLSGTTNVVILNGAGAPTNGVTGANVAQKGSLYIDSTAGALYQNQGTKAVPSWTSAATSGTSSVLTGLSIAAGVPASTDTILQAFNKLAALPNGTFTPTSETVSSAGAISTTKMETILANGGGSTYAATLAAPSSQDGQLKVLKMTTATHTVTVACTNIAFSGAYTPTGTTTLTFTNTGDSAVFMAVGTKWVYLGGTAVAS